MITKDDLTFIAKAIAMANKHPAPEDYAIEVVEVGFPVEVSPDLEGNLAFLLPEIALPPE